GPVVLSQYFADWHLRIGGRAAELPTVARRGVLVLEEAVQPGGMRRVDADLERLQPVAVPVPLERERVLVRRDEAVEARKRRRLAGAEIGEEDAASFRHRIRAQPDVLAHPAAGGLGGRLEAFAAGVVKPAVERAAQTAVLQPAISEVRAAMGAVALEQAVSILFLEQNQILSEEPHRLQGTRAFQFFGERDGLPVVAQQLSRRRP